MDTKLEKNTQRKTASADALSATRTEEIELKEEDLERVVGGMPSDLDVV